MTVPSPVGLVSAARDDPTQAVLEGIHPLKHALRFGAQVTLVVTAADYDLLAVASDLAPDMAARLDRAGLHVEQVPAETFDQLVRRRPRSGAVVALARRPPPVRAADLLDNPAAAPVVLLEDPRHLGNVGAAVRVAAAAGAAGVLVTGDADPWSAQALRGGAGLQYALPVGTAGGGEVIRAGGAVGRPLVALDPGAPPIGAQTVPARCTVAFGSERRGLSPALVEAAGVHAGIPMLDGVSSLNLATAVAAVLYGLRGLG